MNRYINIDIVIVLDMQNLYERRNNILMLEPETIEILGSLQGVSASLALLHVLLSGNTDILSPDIMVDFIWGLYLQVDHTADRLEKYLMDLPERGDQTIYWL